MITVRQKYRKRHFSPSQSTSALHTNPNPQPHHLGKVRVLQLSTGHPHPHSALYPPRNTSGPCLRMYIQVPTHDSPRSNECSLPKQSAAPTSGATHPLIPSPITDPMTVCHRDAKDGIQNITRTIKEVRKTRRNKKKIKKKKKKEIKQKELRQ